MALRLALDPERDAAVGLLQIFEHQLAAAQAVEGEDYRAEGRRMPQSARATRDSKWQRSMGSPPSVRITAPLDVMRGVSARKPSPSSSGAV